MNIMKLSQFKSVDEALEKTKASNIKTILPWLEGRKEGQMLCIPKDAGYEQTEETLENILKKGG